MTQTRRPAARSLMAALLALLLIVSSALVTVAQSPPPTATPTAGSVTPALGAATVGGVLAKEEGRDASAPPVLLLGTALDGLALSGPRAAFAPGEQFAFRLELPGPVNQISLAVQLSGNVDGIDSLWAYPNLPVDPSWDTVAALLPAPPAGDYVLRIFKGQVQVAETPIAVYDVLRLSSLLTDPQGLVAADAERVAAAGKRYEDATGGGWLWNVLIDTTGGIPVADWTEDLWAVNADQIDARDALFVAAAGDIDVAILVGSDAARTIVPDEIGAIEDEAVFPLGDSRFADMIDGVADGLVTADAEGPVANPTPTPKPTPTATPTTVRVPDFIGLSRAEAELRAASRGLETRFTFRQTSEAERGTVVAQEPPAGRSVERGDTVLLVIATTPQTVTVPDVTGLSEGDAVGVLLDAGLEPGIRTTRPSDVINKGDVIRTDPRAGTAVAPGSVVDYIVSRGPEPIATPTPRPTTTPRPTPAPVEVPDVRGLTEADAITVLLDADLKLGQGFGVTNKKVEAGSVIRTDPAAGTFVARGSRIDYFVSLGPPPAVATPTPQPTPGPIQTPRPTAEPTPEPTTPASGDRLARILATGLIRVNIAESDGPWSYLGANGGRAGFDPSVARAIAKKLGVKVEFTTFSIDEVRAGIWDDRFDIAISRLAITSTDPAMLTFSGAYGYDPQQMSVTFESGLKTTAELADRSICVDQSGTGRAWLDGKLTLVGSPLEPAAPPSGAVPYPGPTDADCLALIATGGAPFDGWLASLPTVTSQVAAGMPIMAVDLPVLWAPLGVAFDAKAPDDASLITAIDDILIQLGADGTLVKASIRTLGYDITVVPKDGVPVPIIPVPVVPGPIVPVKESPAP